jgi:hypothetical protein
MKMEKKKLFFHFLDMTILDAYLLHKSCGGKTQLKEILHWNNHNAISSSELTLKLKYELTNLVDVRSPGSNKTQISNARRVPANWAVLDPSLTGNCDTRFQITLWYAVKLTHFLWGALHLNTEGNFRRRKLNTEVI